MFSLACGALTSDIFSILTLRTPHLARLHKAEQSDKIFDDAEVLGPRGAAGVDGDGNQQLLDVTHQELVVVQGDSADGTNKKELY